MISLGMDRSGAGKGRRLAAALLLGIMAAGIPVPVPASEPVSVVLQGCVREGVLWADFTDFGTHQVNSRVRPYRMEVLDAICLREERAGDCRMDLSNLEANRIEISGDLLPGDSFVAAPAAIRALGPCRAGR